MHDLADPAAPSSRRRCQQAFREVRMIARSQPLPWQTCWVFVYQPRGTLYRVLKSMRTWSLQPPCRSESSHLFGSSPWEDQQDFCVCHCQELSGSVRLRCILCSGSSGRAGSPSQHVAFAGAGRRHQPGSLASVMRRSDSAADAWAQRGLLETHCTLCAQHICCYGWCTALVFIVAAIWYLTVIWGIIWIVTDAIAYIGDLLCGWGNALVWMVWIGVTTISCVAALGSWSCAAASCLALIPFDLDLCSWCFLNVQNQTGMASSRAPRTGAGAQEDYFSRSHLQSGL